MNVSGTVVHSCLNGPTGSITITPSGGIPAYTFQWSNGSTTQNISGLTPGAYWVRVTDSIGATVVKTFYVNTSLLYVDFDFQYPTSGGSDGSLKAIVTGNLGNLTYLWNTGATTQQIDNISAGTYSVRVTDSAGCNITEIVTLVDKSQGVISMLFCCSADLAYIYVWAKRNGLNDVAECTIAKLILLQGYLKDICCYEQGVCITEDQKNLAIEKAKTICGCCCGGRNIFEDTLKQ